MPHYNQNKKIQTGKSKKGVRKARLSAAKVMGGKSQSIDIGVKLWGTTFIIVLILLSNPLGRAFVGGLAILPHELGHTLCSWLLGRPAVPVISTVGFYTAAMGDSWLMRCLVLCIWGYFIVQWCKINRCISLKTMVLVAVLLIAFFSLSARNTIISWMGAGGELVVAFVLCYKALNRHSLIAHWKRYVYLIMGVCLYINLLQFASKLCFSDDFKMLYAQGAGYDQLTNDLHQVQESLGFSVTAQAVFIGLLTLLSLWRLWCMCRQPYDVLNQMWLIIKQLPPFLMFAELKSKSKTIF